MRAVRHLMNTTVHAAVSVLILVAPFQHAMAQSVLQRTPNITGGWVGRGGQAHFNIVHRFDKIGKKIVNSPTILTAFGFGDRVLVGLNDATSSPVPTTTPTEWEGFVRVLFDADRTGWPVDVALQGAFNGNTSSVDGELTVARTAGRVRLLGVARAYSNAFDAGEARFAFGGGGVIALSENVALAGDVITLLDRNARERVAWGAALQLGIPYTPHSLSLHLTNTPTATLQGSALGLDDVRLGFEFTVPITLSRFFGRGGATSDRGDAAPLVMTGDTVVIEIASFQFTPTPVQVSVGTTVVWRNADSIEHSTTSDDGSWDSGLIRPGESWSRTFDGAGDYSYHCTPHPFMRGRIVVR